LHDRYNNKNKTNKIAEVTMARIPKAFTGCQGNAREVQRITTQRVGMTGETCTIGTTDTLMIAIQEGTNKGRGIPTDPQENLLKVVQEGTDLVTEKRETTTQKNLAHEAL